MCLLPSTSGLFKYEWGSTPGVSVSDLWRTKWHWDRILRVFGFSPVSIIPSMCYTHHHLHVALVRRTNVLELETFKNAMLLRKWGCIG